MFHRTSLIASLALAAFVLAGTAGCNKVSRDNYDKVQTGMTTQEVKDILGNPSDTQSGGVNVMGYGGNVTTMTWKSGDKSIAVMFVNNKVVQKSMSNL